MSVPEFKTSGLDIKSAPLTFSETVIAGDSGDAKSNYDRGYEAGYAKATADILRTIKEYYGE